MMMRNMLVKKFPEERGMECLADLQLNVLNYLTNRNFQQKPEENFYASQFNSSNNLGILESYSDMRKIQKMLVYGEKSASHCMTFMKHDTKLAIGTSKGTIVLINLNDYLDGMREQKSMRTVKKVHELSINAMRMNNRGDWLLTGDKSGLVKFFKSKILFENQEVFKENASDPEKHQEAVRDIDFAPSNEKYVTCSDDKTVRIADLNKGKVESVLQGHGSDITSVDWHPHYSMIASGGKDRIIKIWDPRMKDELCSLYNHTNSILKVRYSFDGKYLLTGGRDQTVRLFDARSMKELHTYKMHDSDILSLGWNPARNDIFASGDSSGVVNICSVMCNKPICIMDHSNEAEIWDMCWNNLGTFLATCGGDRLVNLFTSKYWIPNQQNFDIG